MNPQAQLRSKTAPREPTINLIAPEYRRYALIMLLLVFTSSHVDRHILAILLESIKRELVLSDTQLGFLSGIAFAIFYATLGIPMAMWADRGNRRNIIALTLALWSGMTVLCGMAVNFLQLALARIGVGVGEAGANPPSHSIIADLYAREERAGAMGVFSMGINLGLLIGFLVGGWINQWYGWRMAFWVVGAPGLALALLVRVTLREPPRGYAEGLPPADAEAPSLGVVLRHMLTTPSLRHIIAGATLASLVGYGVVLWVPAFLARSHGMTSGQIGTTLALMFGIAGGAGSFCGGRLADYLSKRDIRWNVRIVGLAILIAMPFSVLFYLATDKTLALIVYVVPAFLGSVYVGPSFAMNQGLVSLQMRSVASAILLFISNLIGLGVGPQFVGIVSDLLQPWYGVDSLRYALLCLTAFSVWAATHYFLAGRTLQADLKKVSSQTRG